MKPISNFCKATTREVHFKDNARVIALALVWSAIFVWGIAVDSPQAHGLLLQEKPHYQAAHLK